MAFRGIFSREFIVALTIVLVGFDAGKPRRRRDYRLGLRVICSRFVVF